MEEEIKQKPLNLEGKVSKREMDIVLKENERLVKQMRYMHQLFKNNGSNHSTIVEVKKTIELIVEAYDKKDFAKSLENMSIIEEVKNDKEIPFFQNKECKYFPCHPMNTSQIEDFNCAFCFCPLYKMICGQKVKYKTDGSKDCSDCLFIHEKQNVPYIMRKLKLKKLKE